MFIESAWKAAVDIERSSQRDETRPELVQPAVQGTSAATTSAPPQTETVVEPMSASQPPQSTAAIQLPLHVITASAASKPRRRKHTWQQLAELPESRYYDDLYPVFAYRSAPIPDVIPALRKPLRDCQRPTRQMRHRFAGPGTMDAVETRSLRPWAGLALVPQPWVALDLSPWAPASDYDGDDESHVTPEEQPAGSSGVNDVFGMEFWTPVPISTLGRLTIIESCVRWTTDDVDESFESDKPSSGTAEDETAQNETTENETIETDRSSIGADRSESAAESTSDDESKARLDNCRWALDTDLCGAVDESRFLATAESDDDDDVGSLCDNGSWVLDGEWTSDPRLMNDLTGSWTDAGALNDSPINHHSAAVSDDPVKQVARWVEDTGCALQPATSTISVGYNDIHACFILA